VAAFCFPFGPEHVVRMRHTALAITQQSLSRDDVPAEGVGKCDDWMETVGSTGEVEKHPFRTCIGPSRINIT